jgi:hypothetical protein
MGSFDTDGLARLAMLGFCFALIIAGGIGGFAVASIINLGKLCL